MIRVLLLEPDRATAHLYATSMERAGFVVEMADLDLQPKDPAPDVVVLSVERLDRSLLRVIANGQAVPRIVISSDPSDTSRADAFECAAVLIRPVLYDELVRHIRRVIKKGAVEQPHDRCVASSPGGARVEPSRDLATPNEIDDVLPSDQLGSSRTAITRQRQNPPGTHRCGPP